MAVASLRLRTIRVFATMLGEVTLIGLTAGVLGALLSPPLAASAEPVAAVRRPVLAVRRACQPFGIAGLKVVNLLRTRAHDRRCGKPRPRRDRAHPCRLLADEPTSNLDSQTVTGILDLLARLRRENHMTVIIATHDRRSPVAATA